MDYRASASQFQSEIERESERDEMSFFNSLQQYVTDSVASLSLSPKRFSFSREDSGSSATGRSGSTGSVTSTTNTNSTPQQSTTPHGYPKVSEFERV